MEFINLVGVGAWLAKSSQASKIVKVPETFLNDRCLEIWFGNISYEK